MLTALGKANKKLQRREVLKTTTIRDFGGGWNVVDNDLNLSSRFSKVLRNMYRHADGSNALRPGTRYFSTIRNVIDGNILNITYFYNNLIVATDEGEIARIDGTGAATAIWNDTIAGALVPPASGWGNTHVAVNFAQFRGELVVVNGVDKPLLIKNDFTVGYLQDIPTGSNTNTPIAKFVTTVGQWVVMAGVPTQPGTIYISNTQSSGTWPGDTAPNDAATFQVDSAANIGLSEITGIASYRGKLLVMFSDVVVVVALGTFTEAPVHDPQIEDIMPQFGALSHRSIQDLGDDILFADIAGVPSFARSVLSGSLEPSRVSQLIDPEIQASIAEISRTSQLDNMFSVFHRLEGIYMLFIPDGDTWETTTETRCFAYRSKKQLKINAWSEFLGWNWRAACRSDGGRIFFADADKIFVLGDSRFADEFYADRRDDRDGNWVTSTAYTTGQILRDVSDGTVYLCLEDHISSAGVTFSQERELFPTRWALYEGEAIEFDWELPWADFKERMNIKDFRYISFDSIGNAQFNCELYVDNFRTNAETGDDDPALSILMVGGTSPGFGGGDQPYGGGRRAVDERPWPMNIRFKILKIRIKGSTRATMGLRVIAISVAYAVGGLLR